MGHYTLAFVYSQAADHSLHLSPFDPLLLGMLASRAMALFRLGCAKTETNRQAELVALLWRVSDLAISTSLLPP